MRINSNVFDDRQLAIFTEELEVIPSQRIENIGLDDDLFNILSYIFKKNKMNAIVSFNKISNHFSISKVTTGKRLKILENLGIVAIKKHGRSKTLHITKKGKELLDKRETI